MPTGSLEMRNHADGARNSLTLQFYIADFGLYARMNCYGRRYIFRLPIAYKGGNRVKGLCGNFNGVGDELRGFNGWRALGDSFVAPGNEDTKW